MPGTLKQACVLIPLGSPTVSQKRSYVTVRAVLVTGVVRVTGGCTGTGWVPGRVYRWVPGRAIPGTTGYPPSCPGRGPSDSGAGPEGPAGAWSGGQMELGRTRGRRRSGPTPAGPGRSPQGALPGPALVAALQPKGRELTSFLET